MASPSSPGASQSGLACGTSYTFAVEALDAAGNRSSRATLTTSTSACSTPPPPPPPRLTRRRPRRRRAWESRPRPGRAPRCPGTPPRTTSRWRATAATATATYQSTTTQPPTTISGLSCGSAYTFEVDAFDAAGNASNTRVGDRLHARLPRHAGSLGTDGRRGELAHRDEHRAHLERLDRQRRRHRVRPVPRRAPLVGTGTTHHRHLLRTHLQHELHARGRRRTTPPATAPTRATVMVSTTACPDTHAAVDSDRARRLERHPDWAHPELERVHRQRRRHGLRRLHGRHQGWLDCEHELPGRQPRVRQELHARRRRLRRNAQRLDTRHPLCDAPPLAACLRTRRRRRSREPRRSDRL